MVGPAEKGLTSTALDTPMTQVELKGIIQIILCKKSIVLYKWPFLKEKNNTLWYNVKQSKNNYLTVQNIQLQMLQMPYPLQ